MLGLVNLAPSKRFRGKRWLWIPSEAESLVTILVVIEVEVHHAWLDPG